MIKAKIKTLMYKVLNKLRLMEISYADKTFSGTYTIASNGYVQLGTPPSPIVNTTLVMSMNLHSWGANTGAFSIGRGGNNVAYLIGVSGTKVTDPVIRYTYLKFSGGGVLRNLSDFKAFSDFASLRKGGVAVC